VPYKPGHPYHPPKEGLPGRSKAQARRTREISGAIREMLDPKQLVMWHVYRAMKRPGVRLAQDEETEEYYATWDDQGMVPTDEQVEKSINWLKDNGWGLPVQSIQLDQQHKLHSTTIYNTLNVGIQGALGPQALAMMRRLMRGEIAGQSRVLDVTPGEALARDGQGDGEDGDE
jgi:hypothetical protein